MAAKAQKMEIVKGIKTRRRVAVDADTVADIRAALGGSDVEVGDAVVVVRGDDEAEVRRLVNGYARNTTPKTKEGGVQLLANGLRASATVKTETDSEGTPTEFIGYVVAAEPLSGE